MIYVYAHGTVTTIKKMLSLKFSTMTLVKPSLLPLSLDTEIFLDCTSEV